MGDESWRNALEEFDAYCNIGSIGWVDDPGHLCYQKQHPVKTLHCYHVSF